MATKPKADIVKSELEHTMTTASEMAKAAPSPSEQAKPELAQESLASMAEAIESNSSNERIKALVDKPVKTPSAALP